MTAGSERSVRGPGIPDRNERTEFRVSRLAVSKRDTKETL